MIFAIHPDGNMKPSQLSLFPTAQADTWRYSDEDACYSCNRRVYDMEKNAEVCSVDGRIVKPWWAPCEHYDRWFQGFGE